MADETPWAGGTVRSVDKPNQGERLHAAGAGAAVTWQPQPELDLYDYGYSPGASDSAPVLTTAIAAAVSGETIRLPKGQINLGSTPSAQSTTGIVLAGHGGRSAGAEQGTTLLYTAAGARGIDARSSIGFIIERCQIYYNNAAFNAPLIDYSEATATPVSYAGLRECNVGGLGINSTFCSVLVQNAFSINFRDCSFGGAKQAAIGKQVNGDFSNRIKFHNCDFTGHQNPPLLSPDVWTIEDCTFEPLATTINAGALQVGAGLTSKHITFRDCWFGDVTGAASDWIAWNGGGAIVVEGCYFGGNSAANINALRVANGLTNIDALNFIGNTLDNCNGVRNQNNPAGGEWVIIGNKPINGGTVHSLAAVPTPGSIFQSAAGTLALTVN